MNTNISLNLKNYDALVDLARSSGKTKPFIVNKVLEDIGVGNKDVKPIVLQVPKNLLNNKEELKIWLDHRCEGIIEMLYSGEKQC